MKLALARHDLIMRRAIETYHGYVFKMLGDAFCAVFANALDAVSAALVAQRSLYAENWGETSIRVRVALHSGVVEVRGNDYVGSMLNLLARVLTAAHGGQTLLCWACHVIKQAIPRLKGLAALAVAQGQLVRAAQLFAWTDSVREKIDNPRSMTEQTDVDRELAVVRALLGESAFAAAQQGAGRAMTMEQAIAEVSQV